LFSFVDRTIFAVVIALAMPPPPNLHNWMVTDRISRNEVEHINMYEPAEHGATLNQPDDDQEPDEELDNMRHDDDQHEMLQRAVDAATDRDTPAMTAIMTRLNERKKLYASEMTKIAHYRYARRYNIEEHARLRNAIIEQVKHL
jgi:hypothetical protein